MNISKLNQVVKGCGKSKVQLAKECGITRVTLDNALQGADIRVSILTSLAKRLGVSVGYLFDEDTTSGGIAMDHVNNSPVGVHGDVTIHVDTKALQEKAKAMEEQMALLRQLLEEKERTIKILMKE